MLLYQLRLPFGDVSLQLVQPAGFPRHPCRLAFNVVREVLRLRSFLCPHLMVELVPYFLHIVSRAQLSQSRLDPLHTTFGFFLSLLLLRSHRSRRSTRRSRRHSTCSSASTSHVHVILLLTFRVSLSVQNDFQVQTTAIRPFRSSLARALAVLGDRRLFGTFLAWQHVLPLSSTVSTRRLVPTKLLCWHRLPRATTPPISPIWHQATKDWATRKILVRN